MIYDSLPTWREIFQKVNEKEKLDPVEEFIYDNEPAGLTDAKEFRMGLLKALYFFGPTTEYSKGGKG